MHMQAGQVILLTKMNATEHRQTAPAMLQVKTDQLLPHYDAQTSHDIDDMIMVTEFADCEGPVCLEEFLIPKSSAEPLFDMSKLAVSLMSCDYSASDHSGFNVHKESTALLTYTVPCKQSKSTIRLYIQLMAITLYDIQSRANKRAISVSYITTNKKKLETVSYDLTVQLRKAMHPLIHSNLEVFIEDVEKEIDRLCPQYPRFQSESVRAENEDRKRYFRSVQEKVLTKLEELNNECNCGEVEKTEKTELDEQFVHIDRIDPRSNMRPITILCPNWKKTKQYLDVLHQNISPTVLRLISNLFHESNLNGLELFIGRQPVTSTNLAVELKTRQEFCPDLMTRLYLPTKLHNLDMYGDMTNSTISDTTDNMSYQTEVDSNSLLSVSSQPDQDNHSNISLYHSAYSSVMPAEAASPDSGFNPDTELEYDAVNADTELRYDNMTDIYTDTIHIKQLPKEIHPVEGMRDLGGGMVVRDVEKIMERPDVHSTPKKEIPVIRYEDASPTISRDVQEELVQSSMSTKTLTNSCAIHEKETEKMDTGGNQPDVFLDKTPLSRKETSHSNDSFVTTMSSYSDEGLPGPISLLPENRLEGYREYMKYCEQLQGIDTLMKIIGKKSDLQSLIYSVLTSTPIFIINRQHSVISTQQLIDILYCFVPLPTIGNRDYAVVEYLDGPVSFSTLRNKLFIVLMKSQSIKSNVQRFSSFIDLSKDMYIGKKYKMEKNENALLSIFSQKYHKPQKLTFPQQIHRLIHDIGGIVSLYVSLYEKRLTSQRNLDNSEIFKLMKIENECDRDIIKNLAKLLIDHHESQQILPQEGFSYMWSPGRISTPTEAGII